MSVDQQITFGFPVILEDCILIFPCLFKVCIYGMDEFSIDLIEIDFLGSLVKNKLECWLETYSGNCCYGFFFYNIVNYTL